MNIVLPGLLLLFALFELASPGLGNTGSVVCKQFLEIEMTCKPHLPVNLKCFNHTTKPSKPKGRPKGYRKIPFGKKTLLVKLYQTRKSWEEALETCIADGGSLVKIDSSRKQRVIQTIIGLSDDVWIGLRDTNDNDTYMWSDGSSLVYTKWMIFEPSKTRAYGEKENCVRLQKVMFDYSWNDVPCRCRSSFLCEL